MAALVALAAALVALVPAGRSSAVATYTITDLGTLGGGYSVATGINGRGEVVGFSLPSATSSLLHAFLYMLRAGWGLYVSGAGAVALIAGASLLVLADRRRSVAP